MRADDQYVEFEKDMKYALSVRFHIVFWLVMQIYFFYSMDLFGVPFERSLQSKLFFFPFQLIAAYFMLVVLLGRYLYKGQYVKAILGFIFFIFAFSYCAYFIYEYILSPAFNPEHKIPNLTTIILDVENLIAEFMRVIFLTPLILICLEFGVAQYKRMEDVQHLMAQKKAAELNLLKTQIHPGFLLSTLRNLEKLTKANDENGPIVIERLSVTLDYILYKGRQNKISLGEELEAVSDYIKLENIRFKNDTEINLNIEEVDDTKSISPLIIFSFLEFNFEGYSRENIPFSNCEILISEKENRLICDIINVKNDDKINNQVFYEVEKMRRQLNISYPEKYDITSDDSKDYFKINLVIDL